MKDRIAKIREEARLKASAKQSEVEVKNREAISQVVELRLTGVIRFLSDDNQKPVEDK